MVVSHAGVPLYINGGFALKKEQNPKDKQNFFTWVKHDFKHNWWLWFMLLPVIIYYAIFSYAPMYGILLAFKDYKVKKGIMGSPWVGFDYFERFFSGYYFGDLIKNTLGISVYSLLVGFPLAIIFAILLHYLTIGKLKKIVQMVSYAPYFISTVVICGMLTIFMDPTSGVFNKIIGLFGHESIAFLSVPEYFKSIYVWSGVWQGMGWSAIIYISSLAGVDYQMHEAAIIDGASKLQRIRYIDLPSIKPTIIMLLILNLGSLMGVGFEKVYLLQNDLNFSASDIISTYTYRVGLINSDFGYSTAVGLFNTVINLIILVTANNVARKVTGDGLW
jgi:putative aldouronate transport system permease protein